MIVVDRFYLISKNSKTNFVQTRRKEKTDQAKAIEKRGNRNSGRRGKEMRV